MSIDEMIKVLDEARKSIDNDELNNKLANIGVWLVKLKELLR